MVAATPERPAPAGARAPRTTQRVFYFDLTRGIAAQLVVVGHLLNISYPHIFMPPKGQGHPFYIQSFAVVVFFVLSGYLIAGTVKRKGQDPRYTFGRYLVDRAARVLFPMFVALALIIGADRLVFGGSGATPFRVVDLSPSAIVQAFLMTFNHPALATAAQATGIKQLAVHAVGTGAPLWTVVIEWWIYVTFGILALVVARRRRLGVIGGLVLLFAAMMPLAYLGRNIALPLAWLIGMGYAFAADRLDALPARVHGWLVGLGVATFVYGCLTSHNNLDSAATIVPASVAFCSLYFLVKRIPASLDPQGLTTRLVQFVSDYSYSLYLIHFSVITYLWVWLHDDVPAWALVLGGFTLSNLLAMAFYALVERNHRRVAKLMSRALPSRREERHAAG
ncbi:acyltransferase [Tersicoccus solisilvae]|uniref:Acyltransferase n=1 Tax=Tersicoccus solisilvae TaxID=1882339 RepID=A0ABQ1PL07_9MICC|nr:acyltransferase [Tersicoccus solisilvae]GGC99011.1 acyltransferase [Tersicoccus solisilvae]